MSDLQNIALLNAVGEFLFLLESGQWDEAHAYLRDRLHDIALMPGLGMGEAVDVVIPRLEQSRAIVLALQEFSEQMYTNAAVLAVAGLRVEYTRIKGLRYDSMRAA